MQKPMLFTLFTLNTWGIRATSPWQVAQALGPIALMCRMCGKWAWRARKWTRIHSTGCLVVVQESRTFGDFALRRGVGAADRPGGTPCRSACSGCPARTRPRRRVVAVLAVDLELAGVDVVPEEDRLARDPAALRYRTPSASARPVNRSPAGVACRLAEASRVRRTPRPESGAATRRRRGPTYAWAVTISRRETGCSFVK